MVDSLVTKEVSRQLSHLYSSKICRSKSKFIGYQLKRLLIFHPLQLSVIATLAARTTEGSPPRMAADKIDLHEAIVLRELMQDEATAEAVNLTDIVELAEGENCDT